MRKLFVILAITLMLTGCSSTGRGWFSKWMSPVDTSYLRIGMSEQEVREYTRFPDHVNRTVTSGVVREQWVYDTSLDTYYLYLEDGRLVGWQKL